MFKRGFAIAMAVIVQLVEHQIVVLGVAGSSPVDRLKCWACSVMDSIPDFGSVCRGSNPFRPSFLV